MRRILVILLSAVWLLKPHTTSAQNAFQNNNVSYTFSIPSDTWKQTREPDEKTQFTEFIFGTRENGILRIRKEPGEGISSLQMLLDTLIKNKLAFLPGYLAGEQNKFIGKMSGLSFLYTFLQNGKDMAGVVFVFGDDEKKFYAISFIVLIDKFNLALEQVKAIASTFELK
jgi:hypothetical protein